MISPGNSDVEHTLNTLRYADRVKELGTDEQKRDDDDGCLSAAGGGDLVDEYGRPLPGGHHHGNPHAHGGGPRGRHYTDENGVALSDYHDDDDDVEDDDDDYDDDDDGNGHKVGGGGGGRHDEDVSHAMNDLQETLAELQDIEEQVLESHGDLIRDNNKWMTEYEKIYEETIKVVDYDREEYAKRLDSVINQNLSVLVNLQKKLASFRDGLIKEEKISKSIQNPKMRHKLN